MPLSGIISRSASSALVRIFPKTLWANMYIMSALAG